MEINKPKKRLQRRIPVTSLSQILSGEKSCEYSLWFNSRYTCESNVKNLYSGYSPSDGKDKDPTSAHSKLVKNTAEFIKYYNKTILKERQFWYETGSGLFIIGRPDLITITYHDELRIYECKSKGESPSDKKQAALYSHYLPFVFNGYKKANGFVVYEDRTEVLFSNDLDDTLEELKSVIKMLDSNKQPKKIKYDLECESCKLNYNDCQEKSKAIPA